MTSFSFISVALFGHCVFSSLNNAHKNVHNFKMTFVDIWWIAKNFSHTFFSCFALRFFYSNWFRKWYIYRKRSDAHFIKCRTKCFIITVPWKAFNSFITVNGHLTFWIQHSALTNSKYLRLKHEMHQKTNKHSNVKIRLNLRNLCSERDYFALNLMWIHRWAIDNVLALIVFCHPLQCQFTALRCFISICWLLFGIQRYFPLA